MSTKMAGLRKSSNALADAALAAAKANSFASRLWPPGADPNTSATSEEGTGSSSGADPNASATSDEDAGISSGAAPYSSATSEEGAGS